MGVRWCCLWQWRRANRVRRGSGVPAPDPELKKSWPSQNARLQLRVSVCSSVVESPHPDSFNSKDPESPKNAANAAAFTLLPIPTVLLTLRDTRGRDCGE